MTRCEDLPIENANAFYDRGVTFASFTRDWVRDGNDGFGNPIDCADSTTYTMEIIACEAETQTSFEPDEFCPY